MLDDDRIGDLVVQWGQAWEQGQELSVDELCLDNPELKDEVAERIQSVKDMSWLNESDDNSDDDFLHLPDFNAVSNQADETQLPECSLTIDEFSAAVSDSGLMAVDQLQRFRDNHPAEDTQSLARQLVSDKKLTRYQASVLLDGRDQPLLLDRYIILDEIGSGGMGAVFKALHLQMDRVVALKILPKAAVDSPDKVKRFHREVRAAAKLEHPNIVTAFDAHESKGIHYLVMSYVNGSDLAQTVRKQGPLSVGKAVNYITQAAKGLGHAHDTGIVHRDVKPANLLLDKRGTVRILDMGLACFESVDAEHDKTMSRELTQAGAVMGTVAYIAPEQALDTRNADARSDIYSLGCTLYYLLTGSPIFLEDTMMKTIMAHQQAEVPALKDVPDGVESVFQKMVAKNPDDRYQSMTDVISALEAIDIEEEEELGVTQQPDSSSQATHQTATFIDTSRDVIETKPIPRRPKRRWPLIAGCLLGIFGLLWAAGILLQVDTTEGTIIIEIDQPELAGAVVSVDGQKKITIKTGEGSEPIEVVADEKTHTLKVTKGGFEAFTTQFTVKAGGEQTIKVRLEPLKVAVKDEPSTGAAPAKLAASAGRNYALEFAEGATIEPVTTLLYDGFQPLTMEARITFDGVRPKNVQHDIHLFGPPSYIALLLQPRGTLKEYPIAYAMSLPDPTNFGATQILNNDQTAHLAVVYDGKALSLYVDGKLQGKHYPAVMKKRIARPFAIHRPLTGDEQNLGTFRLIMDEVRFSNIARYDDNFTPAKRFEADTNTLALYHFDSGSGDVLKDSSGNGHHGKIVGAKWIKVDD